jgi:hypothetical protein
VSEAGKVERNDVVVVVEGMVDWSPADSGFSDPVEQDQWLTRSGSMLGELVGGGRSQVGGDECLLVVGGRLQGTVICPKSRGGPPDSPGGVWLAGHSRVETLRDQLQRAMAAAPEHSRSTSARYPVHVLATRPGARARQLCLLR